MGTRTTTPRVVITCMALLSCAATLPHCSAPQQANDRCAFAEPEAGAIVTQHECAGFARVEAEQEGNDWCWAACVNMVRKYNENIEISQTSLAERYRGTAQDQTARYDEIIRALVESPDSLLRPRPDIMSEGSRAGLGDRFALEILKLRAKAWAIDVGKRSANAIIADLDLVTSELAAGHPVIVGLTFPDQTDPNKTRKHACVLFAMTRETDPGEEGPEIPLFSWFFRLFDGPRCRVTSVRGFDPDRGYGRFDLTGPELKSRIIFAMSQAEAKRAWQEIYGAALQEQPAGQK